ncbi:TPM domain-containing protein [Tetragenococcus halophilus]|uniref:TPM domain-containing protein n=1 Tax=Tetragenococcus halophilus TaxID=51669 RepID=UPI0010325091
MKEVNESHLSKNTIKNIHHYYRRFKRLNTIYVWICGLFILLGLLFFIIGVPLLNHQKNVMEQYYNTQINQLQGQKEQKEEEIDAQNTSSFETTLQGQKAQYANEYTPQANYYEADIGNSTIAIDRNNIFVSDNAGILSNDVKEKIYQFNRQLDENANGAQFMVVTLDQLPNGKDIESYATDIFNNLGIGNDEEDNGVLYLMSVAEQETRLEVGYGLEGVLTDAESQGILDDEEVVENYQEEDYSEGVSATTDLVANYINSKTPYEDSQISIYEGRRDSLSFVLLIPIVFMTLLFIVVLLYFIGIMRTRKWVKKDYKEFSSIVGNDNSVTEQSAKQIKKLNLYALIFYGMVYWQTYHHVLKNRDIGRLLNKYPSGRKIGRRVLVGDTLYDYRGLILTAHYASSAYNPRSSKGRGRGGGFGGFGGGSFGGGSSGGGGASGGW